MLSNHLILCHPLLPLPSIFPSIRIFSNESVIRWPLSISPSKEYSWVISFRINQFDLLAVEGTLKSLFQHHNFKASIFWCSAFFMVQLSHPHMTTGKNHLGSKITADGDCSHEMKRCLFLGTKAMTNLDSILKSRDISLLTNVHLVKAMVFPVVRYGCESWIIKKAEH